eukprot:1149313-Pelagomonas_calceolata.AAC.5
MPGSRAAVCLCVYVCVSEYVQYVGLGTPAYKFTHNSQRFHAGFTSQCRCRKKKKKKNYVGRQTLPTSIKEKGPHWCRPDDLPTTKFRLREVRQAEKEDRSSNKKESRMIAEILVITSHLRAVHKGLLHSPFPFLPTLPFPVHSCREETKHQNLLHNPCLVSASEERDLQGQGKTFQTNLASN